MFCLVVWLAGMERVDVDAGCWMLDWRMAACGNERRARKHVFESFFILSCVVAFKYISISKTPSSFILIKLHSIEYRTTMIQVRLTIFIHQTQSLL